MFSLPVFGGAEANDLLTIRLIWDGEFNENYLILSNPNSNLRGDHH